MVEIWLYSHAHGNGHNVMGRTPHGPSVRRALPSAPPLAVNTNRPMRWKCRKQSNAPQRPHTLEQWYQMGHAAMSHSVPHSHRALIERES